MNGNPIYTIAIPAFKASFLAACIRSVRQRYAGYELVIVNDASPEPIDEIVSSLSDSRIRYCKNSENVGAEHMVNNWSRCLEPARGTYFVLLGDDDFLDDDHLKAFNELVSLHPMLDVSHCQSKIFDECNFLRSGNLKRLSYWVKRAKRYQLSLLDILRVFRSVRKQRK